MLPAGTPIYCVHFIKDYLPLSLGMIISYAQKRLSNADYDLTARFLCSTSDIEECLGERGAGVFLFSDYMWNVDDHVAASALIKRISPSSITIHGGPSFPSYTASCREFLTKNPQIDFGVVGEGETTAVELLAHLSRSDLPPESIAGLRFLKGNTLVETTPRARATDLDQFPSPYLTGVFDSVYSRATYALIETNRGCPYGCTFCDWGSATLQKVRSFSLERVESEIQWTSARGMRDLYITDANFGLLKRDVDICRMICEAKQKTGFPERVILSYAKNTKKHLVEIVDMMDRSGLIGAGVMSIQARDPGTLEAVRRTNIKTEEYEKLRNAFNERQLPLDTHLMIGLPGSSLESFKADLRYYFFEDINVRIFSTVLLVNSPMAEPSYREKYRIETDESGTITSTSTLPSEHLKLCESIARLYRCAHDYGMLRYFLSYLWWDHSVDPIDFLQDLLSYMHSLADDERTRYPLLRAFSTYDVLNEAALAGFLHVPNDLAPTNNAASPLKLIQATHIRFREHLREHGWRDFYEELRTYTCKRYGIKYSTCFGAALAAQEALMPTKGRTYPHTVELRHDYATYYRMQGNVDKERLGSYAPGTLTIEDPLRLSETGSYRQDWSLTDVWQLRSELPGAGRSTLHRFIKESAMRPHA